MWGKELQDSGQRAELPARLVIIPASFNTSGSTHVGEALQTGQAWRLVSVISALKGEREEEYHKF